MATHQNITIIIDQLTSLLRAAEYYAVHSQSVRGRRFASRTARDTHYLLGQANYLYRVLRDDTAFPTRTDTFYHQRRNRVRITTDVHRTRPSLLWASGYQNTTANIRHYTSTELELLGTDPSYQVDITEFYNSI